MRSSITQIARPLALQVLWRSFKNIVLTVRRFSLITQLCSDPRVLLSKFRLTTFPSLKFPFYYHSCANSDTMLESALDPAHPYYDEKSTAENPKWCKVHVAFRRKSPKLIKLKELQKYAKDGGILQNMQTLRQSRLSVSKVSKKEWDFIMSLVEDDDNDEESGPPAPEAQMIADTAAENGIRAEPKKPNDARSSRSTRAVYNGDVARPLGTKPSQEAENGNVGSSNLGAETTGSNGSSALPPTAGPDQKTESDNPEASVLNGETSRAADPAAKVDTANKTDIEPTSRTQNVAEHLRELANPLEHLRDNVIVNTLAAILPGPLAPS